MILDVVDALLELGEPVELALKKRTAGVVPAVALAWSSQKSGAATCSPRSAISARIPSRSSTWPMVFIVARSCLISTSNSIPATRSKVTTPLLGRSLTADVPSLRPPAAPPAGAGLRPLGVTWVTRQEICARARRPEPDLRISLPATPSRQP